MLFVAYVDDEKTWYSWELWRGEDMFMVYCYYIGSWLGENWTVPVQSPMTELGGVDFASRCSGCTVLSCAFAWSHCCELYYAVELVICEF